MFGKKKTRWYVFFSFIIIKCSFFIRNFALSIRATKNKKYKND